MLKNKKEKKNLSLIVDCLRQRLSDFKSVRSAFTMIELLIIMAIIMTMSGVLLLNFNKNKGSSEVENAANQVVAILRSLQNDAINGKIVNGNSVCKFSFVANAGEKQYTTVTYNCVSGVVESANSFYLTSNGGRSNVTIGDTALIFNSPRGDVNSGSIMLTSGSDSYYVCVVAGGTTGGSNIYTKRTGCP